jgi:type I restriction-modification system DNA methylase subunit
VQKLWNYCNVLRDDGLSYGDYVEQLTYLLLLKMAHEQTQAPWRRESRATWSPEPLEGRWRAFGLEELLQRDKVSLDIFWLKDESLEESANLPEPDVIAAEIVEDLRAALEEFEAVLGDLAPA